MGTLRIKRGTKTALQDSPGYTPLEGELVYTTDTKEVFVGDGATTGGTPVSVSTQNLEDLGNVQALAAQNDQILVYNGSNWAATDNPAIDVRGNIYGDDSTLLVDAINGELVGPINTTSITSSGSIVGNLVGDTTGSHTGNVVGDTTGTHYGATIGYHTGDITGSVFADNSTILVDGVAGVLRGKLEGTADLTNLKVESNVVNSEAMQFNLVTNSQIGPGIRGESARNSLADPQDLQPADGILDIRGYGYYSGSYTINSVIRLKTAKYETFGTQTPGAIELSVTDGDGNFDYTKTFIMTDGGFGFGTGNQITAGFDFDVNGKSLIRDDLKVDKTIQFGSFTTTERDALTAANGMVIYNTSDNKFQGYENGSWVNLV